MSFTGGSCEKHGFVWVEGASCPKCREPIDPYRHVGDTTLSIWRPSDNDSEVSHLYGLLDKRSTVDSNA